MTESFGKAGKRRHVDSAAIDGTGEARGARIEIGSVYKSLTQWCSFGFGGQFRWSFLPPLMIYAAAGISGLTAIVGTFFVKEHLGLSAAFLASMTFWVGLPWALKMPIGHIVDLMWRWKELLVYLGASLISISLATMYALVAHTSFMTNLMTAEAWFVLSTLLAPVGYVIHDVIADAMTVEAVPVADVYGNPRTEAEVKAMHTTMQTLGRVATVGGFVFVSGLNIAMFSDVERMSEAQKVSVYAEIYLLALLIPIISIVGVTKYLNQAWVVTPEVRHPISGALVTAADYSQLGWLLIGVSLISAALPLTTIFIIQRSPLRTQE
jgi:hypothetical protein